MPLQFLSTVDPDQITSCKEAGIASVVVPKGPDAAPLVSIPRRKGNEDDLCGLKKVLTSYGQCNIVA